MAAFPRDMKLSTTDVAHWEESSETLELLFQLIYPLVFDDLATKDFEVVAALAEAAEKWMARAAMAILNFHMMSVWAFWFSSAVSILISICVCRNRAADHPLEVFYYSTKHGYTTLAAQVSSCVYTL